MPTKIYIPFQRNTKTIWQFEQVWRNEAKNNNGQIMKLVNIVQDIQIIILL